MGIKLSLEELERYKVLLEKRARLAEDLPHRYGWKRYSWQRQWEECTNRMAFCTASNQAIWVSEEVLTPSGYRLVGDIGVGDEIYGSDGRPCRVVGIPFRGLAPCYRITFDDGSSVVVSEEHLWVVRFPFIGGGGWELMTTLGVMRKGRYSPGTESRLRGRIGVCRSVVGVGVNSLAYYIGFWIGDGALGGRKAYLYSSFGDLEELFVGRLDFEVSGDRRAVRSLVLGEEVRRLWGGRGFTSGTKELPPGFIFWDEGSRRELLAGLMDSDGYVSRRGGDVSFTTTSVVLRDQFIELINSLGCLVNRVRSKRAYYVRDGRRVYCREAYSIFFRSRFNPFRLSRKASRFRLNNRHEHCRIIYKIEPVGILPCVCFTVDSVDHQFLVTRNFIVTHNSGKSWCNISKAINWMGSRDKWKVLWPESDFYQGWYLYPNQETLAREFETKWRKLLPGPRLKNDKTSPWYWKEFKGSSGRLAGVQFGYGDNSVPLYFLTYTQKITGHQASSVNFLSCDEELPVQYFSEYHFRLMATKGYFSMVFTATLGQEEWRLTMEPEPHEEEKFPDAFKLRVSMFDCLYHEDGSPGHITEEDIKRAIATCINEEEVQRRVYGRFVRTDGRLVPHFQTKLHVVDPHPLPSKWQIYAGVDTGSGGRRGHPAAILFLAVNPERTEGRFFRAWRGDGRRETTAADVFERYKELAEGLTITQRVYDYSDADFNIIATRAGHPFLRADKNRERGWKLLDTLFQYNCLKIHRDRECIKLSSELSALNDDTKRAGRMDDLSDVARYIVMMVPWNWKEILRARPATLKQAVKEGVIGGVGGGSSSVLVDERPGRLMLMEHDRFLGGFGGDIEDEMEEWNEYYGS